MASREALALQYAQAAAAEAGTGATDTIIAGCDIVRFGLFFDGTGNHRDSVGRPTRPWHTNVDLLEEEYLQTDGASEVENVNGQPRKIRYMKEYYRGIGITLAGGEVSYSMGTGRGREGVLARVDEASNDVLQKIREEAKDITPCEIWFDIFGFSRGAAAARFMANRVNQSQVTYGGATATTKFLGLFDTVAAVIGLEPSQGYEQSISEPNPYANVVPTPKFDPDIDIRTNGNGAEYIYHITAKDEIRERFPLSGSVGKTQAIVGAHSDIGGGYLPGTSTDSVSVLSQHGWRVVQFYNERWLVGQQGNELYREAVSRNAVDHALGHNPQRFTIEVTAEFGLQLIALHLMHQEAVRQGVPFSEALPESMKGQSLVDDLQQYLAALKTNQVTPEMEKSIRSKYAHWSANGGDRFWRSNNLRDNISRYLGNVPNANAIRGHFPT